MKKLLQSVSTLLCAIFIVVSPMEVKAESLTEQRPVYYDTEQGRFVNNLEEYMSQLNDGVITPYAPTLEEYESEISLYNVLEPSKKCSNIFGHKWGDWCNWEQTGTVHRSSGPCILYMYRMRYCQRTFCGASQKETDAIIITFCHGDGK